MKLFRSTLLLNGRLIILGCLALSSIPSNATDRSNNIPTGKGQASLVLVRASEPYDSLSFIGSTENRQFKFPVLGSTGLAAWYFQPANESKRYEWVESEGLNQEQTLEIYESEADQAELLRWSELLKRISNQLESIGEYQGESKIAKIRLLKAGISRLPSNLQHELQTDILLSQLFLDVGLSKEAIVETAAGESCSLELSTFSEYCFEVLRTRANAFERIGEFREAREIQLAAVKAFSPHAENVWQRSRLTVMHASAHLNNVHVSLDDSNSIEVQSSVESLRVLLKDRELGAILSTYQRGLMYIKFGSALMRSGDFDGAVAPLNSAEKAFKKSNKLTSLSSVYSLLHSCHYVQGRYLQALDMITLAIDHAGEDSPTYHYYLLVQGNALAKLGRYQQAKASLTTAKSFYEFSQNNYYLSACYSALAVVERELGNYEEAEKLHVSAITFFWDEEKQSPSNLYSYLVAKSESVITSLLSGDMDKSRENAAELERSYTTQFKLGNSPKSLPEKNVVYALARYSSSSGNMADLAMYRDKLSELLNRTPANSYSLEKAQLEHLNLIEDLQKNDFNAAANHFQTLMSYVNETRDEVRLVSFQRGYSNLVKGFAEPFIEKLSLSLNDGWDSDKSDILLGILNQIQGSTVVEASRSARFRIANGAHYNTDKQSSKSLGKEVEVFTAQNPMENYALRAKADYSVLREDVIDAKNRDSRPRKFIHQLDSIDKLIAGLSKDEIYLNFFDTKEHSFILYLSKSSAGIISTEKTDDITRLIETTKLLLVDRLSEPEQILEKISKAFALEDIFDSGDYRHVITTGDGKLSEIPFSTLRVDNKYLGSRVSNTHITSTSYYFSLEEPFDLQQSPLNDIAVIADPNFDVEDLFSLNRGGQDEKYHNWISSLSRLPWTARESRSIKNAFPIAKIAVRTREQATVKSFKNLASNSSILHIATHGYFSTKTPELAGIALTKTKEVASGFLSLNQILKLDIASRLVVFSACETALSETTSGDGGWGLAQVVLYAGARNAVGTLWKIPDRQTAEFFKNFYTALSDGRSDISSSLLAAQRAMLNSQYSHPFYWAGFKTFATKRTDTYSFNF